MKVMIGLQARSTSTRLPNKSLALIDTTTMVDHVIAAAQESANHLNKRSNLTGIDCWVSLLVPQNDNLVQKYNGKVDLVQGLEHDVLNRYLSASSISNPDYIVRISCDCPLISPAIISKHIATAINNKLDYCSNAFENARTYIDGMDCEVISRKLFLWMCDQDLSESHKEHVTTYLREKKPLWAKYGCVVGHVDLSHIKYSVDTKQELEVCRENKRGLLTKIKDMRNAGIAVYRF